jgi:hypothetical protein
MLTDDLPRLVPLDAPGPEVPGGDISFGIDHEDGVVLYPLHQQPEALLALPQTVCGLSRGFARFGRMNRHYSYTSKTEGRYFLTREFEVSSRSGVHDGSPLALWRAHSLQKRRADR